MGKVTVKTLVTAINGTTIVLFYLFDIPVRSRGSELTEFVSHCYWSRCTGFIVVGVLEGLVSHKNIPYYKQLNIDILDSSVESKSSRKKYCCL